MIKLLLLISLLPLLSCGAELKQMKPLVSTKGADSYFTDRHMTGTDFQNFTNTIASQVDSGWVSASTGTRNKIGSTKHKAAGYTGDRNITGDAFSKQFSDYYGKIVRKGEITKGYTSDRLDQIKDPDRKEREQIKDLQARQDAADKRAGDSEEDRARIDAELSGLEYRVAAEEAKSIAQAVLITQLQASTSMEILLAEQRAKDYADANDSDTIYVDDDSSLQDALDVAQDAIDDLLIRVSDAEYALDNLDDDVCSYTSYSLQIVEIPRGHNLHGGWWHRNRHRVLRRITIPVMNCPQP